MALGSALSPGHTRLFQVPASQENDSKRQFAWILEGMLHRCVRYASAVHPKAFASVRTHVLGWSIFRIIACWINPSVMSFNNCCNFPKRGFPVLILQMKSLSKSVPSSPDESA